MLKKYVMSFLFIATPCMMRCGFGEDLAAFLKLFEDPYRAPQPQPMYFNVDEFCAQFDHDLSKRGVPYHDRQLILQKTKQQLQAQTGTVSADVATQHGWSVVLDHIEYTVKTSSRMRGQHSTDVQKLATSARGNAGADLQKGNQLSRYFGNELDAWVKKHAPSGHTTPYQPQPTTPSYTPPQQPRPAVAPSYQPSYAPPAHTADDITHVVDTHDAALKNAGMSPEDVHDFRMRYFENCQKTSFTVGDIVKCSKQQVRGVLLRNLHNIEERKLESVILNKAALHDAAQVVAARIHSDVPDDATPFNSQNVRKYCGANLRETIIEGIGISCSICLEEYRDQMRGGTAGAKVMIPCNKHHVCSNCAHGLCTSNSRNSTCPECRAPFTSDQLQRNTREAEQRAP
jgi:hypothetical protein